MTTALAISPTRTGGTRPHAAIGLTIADDAHPTIRTALESAARIVTQARTAPVSRSRIRSAVTRECHADVRGVLLRAAEILRQLAAPLGGTAA